MLNCFSHIWLFATLRTIARLAPLSMGFSRQEYWSGLPLPSPGDLPNPAIKPVSLTSPTLGGRSFATTATWEAQVRIRLTKYLPHARKQISGKKKTTENPHAWELTIYSSVSELRPHFRITWESNINTNMGDPPQS